MCVCEIRISSLNFVDGMGGEKSDNHLYLLLKNRFYNIITVTLEYSLNWEHRGLKLIRTVDGEINDFTEPGTDAVHSLTQVEALVVFLDPAEH